jgi:hypothetical protein
MFTERNRSELPHHAADTKKGSSIQVWDPCRTSAHNGLECGSVYSYLKATGTRKPKQGDMQYCQVLGEHTLLHLLSIAQLRHLCFAHECRQPCCHAGFRAS